MPEQRARTGLVVVVPEAEAVVGPLRARLDMHAALGVPAHVTVLFPFVPAAELDDRLLGRLAGVLAVARPFDYSFLSTGWFGDDVVWLGPDDPVPFQQLTARVVNAFPAHPPFAGAFGDDVVPHLTIGHRHPRAELVDAERTVLPRLPVTGRAQEVVLLTEDARGGRWSAAARFPLSGR